MGDWIGSDDSLMGGGVDNEVLLVGEVEIAVAAGVVIDVIDEIAGEMTNV